MAEYTGESVVSYYVDGDRGNNSNNGTSPDTAWKTIQYGFDKIADSTLGDGDELRIMATKVYHIGAPLTSTWSGKEVVITGVTSANTALVDGTMVEINGNTAGMDGATMMFSSSSTIDQTIFSNIYFNAADNAKTCYHQEDTGAHGVMFTNCRFSSATEYGFVIDASSYYKFTNCRFDNNASDGLKWNSTQYGLIYKSLFDNNGGDGARLGWSLEVVECVFFGNSGDGCHSSNSNVTHINNVLQI